MTDAIINPISMLIRTDTFHLLNLLNFKGMGLSTITEATAFRKSRTAAKITALASNAPIASFDPINVKSLSDRNEIESALLEAIGYGLLHQTSILSKSSSLSNQTLFDNFRIESFLTGEERREVLHPSSNVNLTAMPFQNCDTEREYFSPITLEIFVNKMNQLANESVSQ